MSRVIVGHLSIAIRSETKGVTDFPDLPERFADSLAQV
ncbi:hypothetical protein RIEGSTA812A_PEG_777 [invertebrate metagenome]|uniref:Uncharacterized protein n=1 Tax=invertebrate metagenome TaxID=1711999 RepID=A0A484H6S4_9ZZZZ